MPVLHPSLLFVYASRDPVYHFQSFKLWELVSTHALSELGLELAGDGLYLPLDDEIYWRRTLDIQAYVSELIYRVLATAFLLELIKARRQNLSMQIIDNSPR